MNLAGQLEVLTKDEMQMVHEKACELLANKGVVFQSEKALETFRANGAKVDGQTVLIPKELVEKTPIDGLCGKSDEENLGFTYAELDKSIRTGEIEDKAKKEIIDRKHKANLFKLELMPVFKPEF